MINHIVAKRSLIVVSVVVCCCWSGTSSTANLVVLVVYSFNLNLVFIVTNGCWKCMQCNYNRNVVKLFIKVKEHAPLLLLQSPPLQQPLSHIERFVARGVPQHRGSRGKGATRSSCEAEIAVERWYWRWMTNCDNERCAPQQCPTHHLPKCRPVSDNVRRSRSASPKQQQSFVPLLWCALFRYHRCLSHHHPHRPVRSSCWPQRQQQAQQP